MKGTQTQGKRIQRQIERGRKRIAFQFKDMSLKRKATYGFVTVFTIMFISAMIGLLGLLGNSHKFAEFRMLTEEGQLANQIDSDIYSARLNFKKYETSSDRTFVSEYEALDLSMRDAVKRLKTITDDQERNTWADQLMASCEAYKGGYNRYVASSEALNAHYKEGVAAGGEIIQDLNLIMDQSKGQSHYAVFTNASEAYASLLAARLSASKYFDFHKDSDYKSYLEHYAKFEAQLKALSIASNDNAYRSDYANLMQQAPIYKEAMSAIHEDILSIEAIKAELEVVGPQISALTTQIKDSVQKDIEAFSKAINASNQRNSFFVGVVFLLAILFGSLLIISILKLVLEPINFLKNTFEQLAEGDADTDFRLPDQSADEVGQMSKAFNQFMRKLKHMTDDLTYKNLLKTAESDLSELVRQDEDLSHVSNQMIQYICHSFDMLMGAIYLEEGEKQFQLYASYAYTRRKGMTTDIEEGVGVLGQVLREKKMFVINDLPEDYILVQSGLGDAKPKALVVLPCLNDGEIVGLVEMASFGELTDSQLTMLETLSEVLGRLISTIKVRHQMKTLLEKTLAQAEELQVQQEELRQSNEELEEQARALKESESKLQLQQEELRVSNEELEAHSKQLEEQKRILNEKNAALENTQEEMLRKAEALEKTSKYKSEFLANMSHELRTPLNSILVLSQLLADRSNLDPLSKKEMEFASTIHASGKDLLTLINGVLDLSKVEAGKLQIHHEEISLTQILADNRNMFEPMAESKGILFQAAIEKDLPEFIETDIHRLNQITKNLLSNAIKFTHEGQVSLLFRAMTQQERVQLGLENDHYLAIEVKDTGIGIPEDKLEEVFEAFKQSDGTTSRQYGGTGLGLTISLELAHLLGGDILLESQVGKGSSFTLVLPFSATGAVKPASVMGAIERMAHYDKVAEITEEKRTSAEAVVEALPTVTQTSGRKHILIIEDDKTFSQILEDLAAEKGYTTSAAFTGKEGIAMAKAEMPMGIILDIGLPDMDGMLLAQMLSEDEATQGIPIHIISGSENLDESSNGLETPGSIIGFLKKPVDIKSIYKTLAKIEKMDAQGQKRILVVGTCGNEDFKKFSQLGQVEIQKVATGEAAMAELETQTFGCIILDVKLPDIKGVDFMSRIRQEMGLDTPIIIYTDESIEEETVDSLQQYAESIILKSSKSKDRLVDEVSLFLHDMNRNEGKSRVQGTAVSEDQQSFNGVKVLLADDDSRNVFALMHALEKYGMQVIVAKDGHEAVSKFMENGVDIVLMDIMMPGLDGYEATRQIRATDKGRSLPIIALTAKAMNDDREKCIEAGANDYLTKPVEVSRLLSMMKVWLS